MLSRNSSGLKYAFRKNFIVDDVEINTVSRINGIKWPFGRIFYVLVPPINKGRRKKRNREMSVFYASPNTNRWKWNWPLKSSLATLKQCQISATTAVMREGSEIEQLWKLFRSILDYFCMGKKDYYNFWQLRGWWQFLTTKKDFVLATIKLMEQESSFAPSALIKPLSDSRRMRIKRGSDKDQGDGDIHEIGTKRSHT